MKAKDYYNQMIAENPQTEDEFIQSIGKVIEGLNAESKELIKKRKAQRNDAIRGIIRELNNKWNALVSLWEKDHNGKAPIRRNAYWDAWVKQIPELDPNYTENRVLFDYENPNVLTTLAMLGAAAEGKL